MKRLLLFAAILVCLFTVPGTAATVSGTLTYSGSTIPLTGQTVYLTDSGGGVINRDTTITDAAGGYTFVLPSSFTSGSVELRTNACSSAWSSGWTAFSGSSLTVNFSAGCALPAVFDTVRNSTTNQPVWGQKVYLMDSTATYYYLDSAYTDRSGVAVIVTHAAIVSGTIRIFTNACGRQSQTISYSGSSMTIAPTMYICASTPSVSGTVTNSSTSAVVPYHKVNIVDSLTASIGLLDSTHTNASGVYSILVPLYVPSGNMIAYVQACGSRHSASSTYTGGSVTLNLSVCSSSSATISGKVTDGAGAAVSGRKVYLLDTSVTTTIVTYLDSTLTNSAGNYSFPLPATVMSGVYKVYTTTCGGSRTMRYLYYSGSSLTANFTVCGSTPATVSGTVTRRAGIPFAGAKISIMNASGAASTVSTTTASNGSYSITIPVSWPVGTITWIDSSICGQYTYSHYYNGLNIIRNDSLCPYSLSGTVTKQGGGVAAGAKVYLIAHHRDTITTPATVYLSSLDSTITNSTGGYIFYSSYPPGTGHNNYVHLKAALMPGDPAYSNYLPTYLDSSLVWSGADSLTITDWMANATNLNISLRGGVNPGGPGFIGGSVLLGANKTTAAGDPLTNRMLLLTTAAGQAIGYTYSDASGKFSFSNLAYGSYRIFGDAWGKTNLPLSITISAGNAAVRNIIFEENSTAFKGSLANLSVSGNGVLEAVRIYPNPAKDNISLYGLERISGMKTLTLRSVTGAVLSTMEIGPNKAGQMSVSHLPAGMYLLHLQTAEGDANYRFIKE